MQRSSLFFNQWLIARVGEEISPRATFTRFKQYVEHVDLENGQKVADLLPLIRKQAETYEAWTTAAAEEATGSSTGSSWPSIGCGHRTPSCSSRC